MRQPREGGAPSGPPQGFVVLRRVEVVRTYLALDSRTQLRPVASVPMTATSVDRPRRLSPCPVPLYRRLYKEVGEQWYWHDRLAWSDQRLADHLAAPTVGMWVLYVDDEAAGYFELQRHVDGGVEILYLGLMPKHLGRKLGGYLLTCAVEEAWAMGANRVWLHTCTLDSERALPNYKARGFSEFKTERLEVEIEGTQVVSERIL